MSALFQPILFHCNEALATYFYEGICPLTGERLRLPRTQQAEAIAQKLMQDLANDPRFGREGKMYGILVAKNSSGEIGFLKAFSGCLQGQKDLPGWVPLIAPRDQLILEEQQTLSQLATIKEKILALKYLPERERYQQRQHDWQAKIQQLNEAQRQTKLQRQTQRHTYAQKLTGNSLRHALAELDDQSRQEGLVKRRLKQQRDQELVPLQEIIEQSDAEIRRLRQRRQHLSRRLQQHMHQVYTLSNFAGRSQSIAELFPQGMPTGTGDCCAPKLLHYAAQHQLVPIAMAEFWWGNDTTDKIAGEFYPACTERCQPLMGFLLSGLNPQKHAQAFFPLDILYRDRWLIATHKPAGLLSVPGRGSHKYDSVWAQLSQEYGDIFPVHRLDQDTSGVLLFALDLETQKILHGHFQQRKITKIYDAILEKPVVQTSGTIDLPLCRDLHCRPYQKVDFAQGKPSHTIYKKLAPHHLELQPITGRTHQLRVHCAHPLGLGNPIVGDRLYGDSQTAKRLHLHARQLMFEHPHHKTTVHIHQSIEFT